MEDEVVAGVIVDLIQYGIFSATSRLHRLRWANGMSTGTRVAAEEVDQLLDDRQSAAEHTGIEPSERPGQTLARARQRSP